MCQVMSLCGVTTATSRVASIMLVAITDEAGDDHGAPLEVSHQPLVDARAPRPT